MHGRRNRCQREPCSERTWPRKSDQVICSGRTVAVQGSPRDQATILFASTNRTELCAGAVDRPSQSDERGDCFFDVREFFSGLKIAPSVFGIAIRETTESFTLDDCHAFVGGFSGSTVAVPCGKTFIHKTDRK